MSGLTTHVLDTANGTPAANMAVRLRTKDGTVLVDTKTNADGRCDKPLLSAAKMHSGSYRLEFDVAAYYRAKGTKLPDPPFLGVVVIDFSIADTDAHYHVPLLVSPYGYSTYRGS